MAQALVRVPSALSSGPFAPIELPLLMAPQAWTPRKPSALQVLSDKVYMKLKL